MIKVIGVGSKTETIDLTFDGDEKFPFSIDFENCIGTFHCMTSEQFKELHKAVNDLYILHLQGK